MIVVINALISETGRVPIPRTEVISNARRPIGGETKALRTKARQNRNRPRNN